MKELKFTPENLERHLKATGGMKWSSNRRRIITTRTKILGKEGDIFKIEGAGYFVLERAPCEYKGLEGFYSLVNYNFEGEGFPSASEFAAELVRIYGGIPETLYKHYFAEVFGIEGGDE